MFNFVKKWGITFAVNIVVKEIEKAEVKDPKIKEFRSNLFTKTANQFITWGTSEIGGNDMDMLSPIQLLKKRMEPLRDDVEGYLGQFIDGLNPNK